MIYLFLHIYRILISTFEADVDAPDENKDTPLYHALKFGNENIVAFLLQEGANLKNERKDAEDPLHLARTPKIARLLLDYGADPNAIDKEGNDVLTSLMKRTDTHDDVAKVLMDDCITTNGKEMDSRDLLVVYNLDFFRNGKVDKDKMNDKPQQVNGENETKVKLKKKQGEFSKIKNMDKHDSDLLYHPLSEAMIRLKWNKTRTWRYATNIIRTIFAASFTIYVIGDVEREHNVRIDQRLRFGNETEFLTSNITNATDPDDPERCLPFKYFASHLDSLLAYFTTFLSAVLLLFCEIYQLCGSTHHYFKVPKNVLELTMITITLLHLLLVALSFCEVSCTNLDTRSIAAISIFLAWVNIIVMLSVFSKVGIYIHMFLNVSSRLLFFLLIFSPAFIAFALSFRVLMPPKVKVFDRFWISLLKTMAMLIGELDYDGTFINNDNLSSKEGLVILIQIMSILFLCFGSIVIMNLLVGLTVSEIDNLKSEARQVTLKDMFSELLSDRKIRAEEAKGNFPILNELDGKRTKKQETLKICVEPNAREMDYSEECRMTERCPKVIKKIVRKLISVKRWFIPKKYNVFFYDETHDEGNTKKKQQKQDTEFQFSKVMVDNTVNYLKEKEKMRNDLVAQLNYLEDQLIDDMEDVVSKHTDEILDLLRELVRSKT